MREHEVPTHVQRGQGAAVVSFPQIVAITAVSPCPTVHTATPPSDRRKRGLRWPSSSA